MGSSPHVKQKEEVENNNRTGTSILQLLFSRHHAPLLGVISRALLVIFLRGQRHIPAALMVYFGPASFTSFGRG